MALWKISLLVAVKYDSPMQSLAPNILGCWLPRAGRCVGEGLLMDLPEHLVLTTTGGWDLGQDGIESRAILTSLQPHLLLKHSVWARMGPSPVPRTLTWVTQT